MQNLPDEDGDEGFADPIEGGDADAGDNPDAIKRRQEQALMFEKYLEESGLCLSFQIIFTEIIQKQIPEDQVFPYTAMRLRQIGKELDAIDSKAGGGHEV